MKKLSDFALDQFAIKVMSKIGGTFNSKQFAKIEEMANNGHSVKDTVKAVKEL